jgi:alkylation response protein AidB-like acyl-CoA dehydrogenase
MDFELSNEMKMLADMAYKFALQEVEPVVKMADEEEKYTPDVRKKAGVNGLIGCWIPEEYGGSGAGFLGNTIITEQLSRVCMGIGLNIVAATFGCENIYYYGTKEQKEKYLPLFARAIRSLRVPIRNQTRARMWPVTKQGRFRTEMII